MEPYVRLRALKVDVDQTGLPDHNDRYSVAIKLSREPSKEEIDTIRTVWGSVTDNTGRSSLSFTGETVLVSNTTIENIIDGHGRRLREAIHAADKAGENAWIDEEREEIASESHYEKVRKLAEKF